MPDPSANPTSGDDLYNLYTSRLFSGVKEVLYNYPNIRENAARKNFLIYSWSNIIKTDIQNAAINAAGNDFDGDFFKNAIAGAIPGVDRSRICYKLVQNTAALTSDFSKEIFYLLYGDPDLIIIFLFSFIPDLPLYSLMENIVIFKKYYSENESNIMSPSASPKHAYSVASQNFFDKMITGASMMGLSGNILSTEYMDTDTDPTEVVPAFAANITAVFTQSSACGHSLVPRLAGVSLNRLPVILGLKNISDDKLVSAIGLESHEVFEEKFHQLQKSIAGKDKDTCETYWFAMFLPARSSWYKIFSRETSTGDLDNASFIQIFRNEFMRFNFKRKGYIVNGNSLPSNSNAIAGPRDRGDIYISRSKGQFSGGDKDPNMALSVNKTGYDNCNADGGVLKYSPTMVLVSVSVGSGTKYHYYINEDKTALEVSEEASMNLLAKMLDSINPKILEGDKGAALKGQLKNNKIREYIARNIEYIYMLDILGMYT